MINVYGADCMRISRGNQNTRRKCDPVGLSTGLRQTILTEDLGMRRVSTISSDNENLLKNVIIGGEAWVYGYDVETKQTILILEKPISPRPKKTRQCSRQ
jgi:hypothetical protein